MEEDAARKKRTDCVYFLASRLTCRKGKECEFRHSERVRLNPRDCFYWLKGSCLNLNCGFRHPPLEGITESAVSIAQFPAYCAVRTSKSNVPCRYYLSSQCIKGDQCPFLHDAASDQKLPKEALEPTTIHPLEIKTSNRNGTGTHLDDVSPIPSEGFSEMNKLSESKKVRQPSGGSALEETSPSQESSVPEFKKPAIKLHNSPFLAAECKSNSSRHYSPDQNSEKALKDCTESDDTPESSPGFNVPVDDGLEVRGSEDDPEYIMAQERESEMCHNRSLQFDFEGIAGCNHLGYTDGDSLSNDTTHDSYEHLHSTERFLDPMSEQKRRLAEREFDDSEGGGVDLRNCLRKKRRMDVHRPSHNSCKHYPSRPSGNSRVQPTRHETGLLLHDRLASDTGKSIIGLSQDENESAQTASQRQGLSEYSHPISNARLGSVIGKNMIGLPHGKTENLRTGRHRNAESRSMKRRGRRQRHGNTGQGLSSDLSLRLGPREALSSQAETPGYTAQEQKRRPKAGGTGSGSHISQHQRRHLYEDFEGPKSLSELLKEKGEMQH